MTQELLQALTAEQREVLWIGRNFDIFERYKPEQAKLQGLRIWDVEAPPVEASWDSMFDVSGVVPLPARAVALRGRRSTGIGHAGRLMLEPSERDANPHLPVFLNPPRPGFPLLVQPQPNDAHATLAVRLSRL